jgi:hypothetical protein
VRAPFAAPPTARHRAGFFVGALKQKFSILKNILDGEFQNA